ncbi:hypothetical protein AGOR_G00086780 [Albula goreensis]|uniref:Tumor necrosis factor alpha-induced protein 2 n=1 Tax=Albula goreensis TaxID=1534307 RepID=A0A8T3DSG0_9TELE|nr:hypothetical protein AGOR_G00086780 [Albula goreensis]
MLIASPHNITCEEPIALHLAEGLRSFIGTLTSFQSCYPTYISVFWKHRKLRRGRSCTTKGQTTEEVEMLKDGSENGVALSDTPPKVTPETPPGNHKNGKHKIKLPKFKRGPRRAKGNISTVNDAPPMEPSFKENLDRHRYVEAGHQLVAREKLLSQRALQVGAEGEVAEGEGKEISRDEEEDALQEDYEFLLFRVWQVVQSSLSATQPHETEALKSALSFILQEEEQDQRWRKEAQEGEGEKEKWVPNWRPRECRVTHDALLRTTVEERMDGAENVSAAEKLSTSLKKEVCKLGKQAQADLLRVARDLKSCYPNEFDVCNTYAQLYHQAFSRRLAKMAEFELDFNDLVYLLSWAHNYYPNDVLKHKELEPVIDGQALGPLLPENVSRPLEEKYFSCKEGKVREWVSNALRKEEDCWCKGEFPELEQYYFSAIAIDVIPVVEGALKETTAIFGDVNKAQRIVCQLEVFLQSYKKSLEEFMKGKSVNTKAVIKGNLASIEQFKEYVVKITGILAEETKARCWSLLEDMEDCSYKYFLDIIDADLKPKYKQLWTQAWLTGGSRQLEEQLEGHIQDCGDLKPTCRQELLSRLHLQVMQEYVKRMMKGKLKLKTKEQHEVATSLLCEDSKRLSIIFLEAESKEMWLQDILPKISEVLKLQDPGAIQLEVITLARDYSDLSEKHISALLHIKANLSNSHIKTIKDSLTENRSPDATKNVHSFFSRVPIKWRATIM